MSWQVPAMQADEALAEEHACPHAPQSCAVESDVSQPFAALPSQSAYPGSQTGTHWPASHRLAPWGLTHTLPQAPQLSVSLWRWASQPSNREPLQSTKPGAHAPIWQTPPAQTEVASASASANRPGRSGPGPDARLRS